MIGETMLRGIAAGAWVIGFAGTLGLFIAFVWLFCTVMAWAVGGKEDDDGEESIDE